MRSVHGVGTAIITQIPKDIPEYNDIVKDLNRLGKDILWKAPEQYVESWLELSHICQHYLFDKYSNETWFDTIGKIVTDKLDYKEYLN